MISDISLWQLSPNYYYDWLRIDPRVVSEDFHCISAAVQRHINCNYPPKTGRFPKKHPKKHKKRRSFSPSFSTSVRRTSLSILRLFSDEKLNTVGCPHGGFAPFSLHFSMFLRSFRL